MRCKTIEKDRDFDEFWKSLGKKGFYRKKYKIFLIILSHTIVDPGTVMVLKLDSLELMQ